MVNRRKRILTALFDVKPVTIRGDLDVEKIKQVKAQVDLRKTRTRQERQQIEKAVKVGVIEQSPVLKQKFSPLSRIIPFEVSHIETLSPTKEKVLAELDEIETFDKLLETGQAKQERYLPEVAVKKETASKIASERISGLEHFYFPEVASQDYSQSTTFKSQESVMRPAKISFKSLAGFLIVGLFIALIIPMVAWFNHGLELKEDVLSNSLSAYQNLLAARQSLEQTDWQAAEQNFGLAHSDFTEAHQEINKLGKLTLGILEQLPGGSIVSSGTSLVKVGESLARAGQTLTSAINLFSFDNLFGLIDLTDSSQDNTLTGLMADSQNNLSQALADIKIANQELGQVEIDDLPADIQEGVASLKVKLPFVEEMLEQAIDYSAAFLKILGHDNPRQYLLIFQNNSEIRATGGFIGTYGLLDLDRGEITNLFVDGVFNADGQLHEKVIPPLPIQKISTAWSMHDANWFADFPTSAQKISWFYEKTGGPTVDGVISFTPTVIERLLELTGPISMPEYGVVLTPDNFVELIQYKVEVDYDKELNQPKKILADFSPKFIEALSQLSGQQKTKAIEIILNCLKEKHILIYFTDYSLEKMVAEDGWAGQLLTTDKDYLSVVSSNINGYKTDRVVKETINHQAEIQEDGSIIVTLTITRQHQGGGLEYDWWNRVNANYLRVYLPRGSQLISAQGQSLEIYQPPVDYQTQSFKTDALVNSIESRMTIDKKTGTHIFEENNKTVFGNWVYVSPGETVILTYQYKLPFKINLTKSADSYSLLVQKQSGSLGSQFSHQLKFPANWQISWKYPEESRIGSGTWQQEIDLSIDRFLGVTFEF